MQKTRVRKSALVAEVKRKGARSLISKIPKDSPGFGGPVKIAGVKLRQFRTNAQNTARTLENLEKMGLVKRRFQRQIEKIALVGLKVNGVLADGTPVLKTIAEPTNFSRKQINSIIRHVITERLAATQLNSAD